jgi:uncharacterized protein (TIGR02246 family)
MHRFGTCLAAVGLLVASSVSADDPAPALPTAAPPPAPVAPAPAEVSDEALHDALRKLQVTMERALNARELDTILANVDDRVVFTTMNGDVVRGKDGIKAYFTRMMEGPDKVVESVTSDFEADDLSILHDKHTAIAFGHTNDHYKLSDGDSFDILARWSGTMLWDGDKWRIASFHYSTNVFDNEVLRAQRKLMLTVGAAALVIALVIGILVGRSGRKAQA